MNSPGMRSICAMHDRREIDRSSARIRVGLKRAQQVGELEVQADLAGYWIIQTYGFLEQSLLGLAVLYGRTHGDERIASHLEGRRSLGRTPNKETISQFVASFDRSWREDILRDRQAELDHASSLATIRNQLAHGSPVSTQPSLQYAVEYFKSAKDIVNYVADMLGC